MQKEKVNKIKDKYLSMYKIPYINFQVMYIREAKPYVNKRICQHKKSTLPQHSFKREYNFDFDNIQILQIGKKYIYKRNIL